MVVEKPKEEVKIKEPKVEEKVENLKREEKLRNQREEKVEELVEKRLKNLRNNLTRLPSGFK